MCATCGCAHGETRLDGIAVPPVFDLIDFEARATCFHDHASPSRIVEVEQDILGKNNALAGGLRAGFADRGIVAINLLSSPGSGKTSLLVRTITDLGGAHEIAVIEGDQETSNDAERIRATGVAAVQVNTGRGCHLDAAMVMRAVDGLAPKNDSFLFIENVGNLVCPAAFDLGEKARVVVISVTEGEDKPLKYPDMFASADLVLINKIDLLPYLKFDLAALNANLNKINQKARVLGVSATTGEGLDMFYQWLGALGASATARV
jgi:hydrogenase nickel incorporation protein HypB